MNGTFSSRPRSSRVASISHSGLTSTTSPTRSFKTDSCLRVIPNCTPASMNTAQFTPPPAHRVGGAHHRMPHHPKKLSHHVSGQDRRPDLLVERRQRGSVILPKIPGAQAKHILREPPVVARQPALQTPPVFVIAQISLAVLDEDHQVAQVVALKLFRKR